MSRILPLPELKYLQECFDYNEDTGILTWKKRPLKHFKDRAIQKRTNSTYAGKEAGNIEVQSTGYIRHKVYVCGHSYVVARIIWKLKTGEDPGSLQVDHRNGKSTDNSWDNLRLATGVVNQRNRKTPSTNTSGVKGVYWHEPTGQWRAKIRVFGKQIHLGSFTDNKDALSLIHI